MACQASPPVTIVQYDATSSSQFEVEEGLGCLVLCLSQLSPPQLCAEESGESDRGGHLEEDCEQPPSTAVLSSTDEEEKEPESVQQCIVISSTPEEDFADQSTADVVDISVVDSWTATSTQPDLTAIPVESSSGQEEERPSAVKRARLELSPSESDRLKGVPRTGVFTALLVGRRKLFLHQTALSPAQYASSLRNNHQAEERILCKFFFSFLLMWV